ncbi:MAG: AAA family ATPase [Synechococcus sp. SB0678_bin_12]|uniref:AAA family ATPase n=1 Tax=Synechococcus sp. SB0676_bin_10 TaxID=2604869 RepID=A0A6B1F4N6_9SYNE|nr:AAA family ATPase [Synechococcus sp. SB0677_bin_5]MYF36289.1 AAA family ATPase [Synechococcus sp. SB0678_bin_12]MYG37961.1 AAA family ATPase [Synechococcus sp. SB0676_bin_10]MYI88192.1 AAA family ATPase [Synechococcus sp. SB0672_bin_10]MYK07988.1 AAA family ATPase [Synechococcus sp. SB0670_bin_20]
MIETIHVENFKALKSIDLTGLPPLAVFVGKNGVGKTSLFRVFSFLKNCLSHNVRVALEQEGDFNGFKDVVTRGAGESESIVIQLKFYLTIAGKRRLVTYYLAIGLESEEPVVRREILRYKRAAHGAPFHFIDFSQGKGLAVSNEEDFSKPDIGLTREEQAVNPDVLAVSSLGQLKRFKAATAFRELIENWHISDFDINQARGKKVQELGAHLSRSGDNLPSVALHMKNKHSDIFEMVLQKVRDRVPGISDIEVKPEGGSLLIRYADNAFQDPFLDKNVSDGTIKMFAYLLLLHDPKPHKVLCVEEPENHLYPELMTILAEDFQEYASKGGQVFVSTHSPQFLNAIPLKSLFLIEKSQGVSRIMPFTADPLVRSQMEAGDHAGYLWEEGMFAGFSRRVEI